MDRPNWHYGREVCIKHAGISGKLPCIINIRYRPSTHPFISADQFDETRGYHTISLGGGEGGGSGGLGAKSHDGRAKGDGMARAHLQGGSEKISDTPYHQHCPNGLLYN